MDKLKELGLGSRLKRLSDSLMKEITLVYKKVGIDFDPYLFPVFKTIVDEKKITTSIITKKLKVSQPSVTQSINKLFKKELILYKTDKLDSRKKNIELSIKGKKILKEITPLWTIIDKTIKNLTNEKSNSFIEQVNNLDNIIANNMISDLILTNYQKYIDEIVEIIPYKKEYAINFKDLNIDWLEKYFVVEPHDSELLENCQENIIDKNGYIFFAAIDTKIVGCYSFIKSKENEFELGKMVVSPEYQGRKIGQKLLAHSIDFAKHKKWEKVILYSNTKLQNAIHLYKKFGFIEVPLEKNVPYLRSDIKMEISEY